MLLRKFEMPWRTTYEAYSLLVWAICLVAMLWLYLRAPMPHLPFLYLAALAFAFLVINAWATYGIWRLKFSLGGKGISFISDGELVSKVDEKPDLIWVGRGYEWTDVHTQRLYEMKRADPERMYPPRWVMRLAQWWTGQQIGAIAPEYIGAPWIHGLEPRETDLYVPVQNWIGNTLLVGTTRCGKTRKLELIAQMAIQSGYCVVCIDPKGDQPFEASLIAACRHANRQSDYVRLHLAFPSESSRIDPLKNFNNLSDVPSRISALMPGGDRSSSFRDFAWSVLNAINLGMYAVGEKATLVRLRSYVDTGVADLLCRVLLRFFDSNLTPNWEMDVAAFQRTLKQGKGKASEDGEILVRQSLNLLLAYYLEVLVTRGLRSEAIEALATIHKHDAAHYGKMIANLVPILGMLTTGELGPLLSPDPADISDSRPMTDMLSLIKSNAVVYIGLDSLANKTISGAVGSMLLSDLTSVAASIYNFGGTGKKIFLIVDEAAEVVNDPYIAMLNKSAGAGFVNIAAIQTVPDLSARFDSMDKALMMLGNFNNLFAMRIKDRVTQDFVIETFGRTFVHLKQVVMGTSTSTADNILHFSGSVQERVTENLDDKMPTDILGQLPNWQYIAAVSGGRLLKGRLPIITHEEKAA